LHDLENAKLALDTSQVNDQDPTVNAGIHFVRGEIAIEIGDTNLALTELRKFRDAFEDPIVSYAFVSYDCLNVLAEEFAGHPERADALLASIGTFVDCYRFRGDILDRRGDWAGAQKAYADGVRLAPDLPAVYYSWGVALAKHGDLSGAQVRAKVEAVQGIARGLGKP
jgi:tetratricopeptide (TPR) repeat protein